MEHGQKNIWKTLPSLPRLAGNGTIQVRDSMIERKPRSFSLFSPYLRNTRDGRISGPGQC